MCACTLCSASHIFKKRRKKEQTTEKQKLQKKKRMCLSAKKSSCPPPPRIHVATFNASANRPFVKRKTNYGNTMDLYRFMCCLHIIKTLKHHLNAFLKYRCAKNSVPPHHQHFSHSTSTVGSFRISKLISHLILFNMVKRKCQ